MIIPTTVGSVDKNGHTQRQYKYGGNIKSCTLVDTASALSEIKQLPIQRVYCFSLLNVHGFSFTF